MAVKQTTLTLILAVASLAFAPLATAGASHELESLLVADPIALDGDPAEWGGLPSLYLEESVRVFSVTHDNDNLYIMYRFADERLARQLLRRGVMLWLNGDGKSKNKGDAFGVRYAGSSQIEEYFEAIDESDQGERRSDLSGGSRFDSRHRENLSRMLPTPDKVTVIRMGIKEEVPDNSDAPSAASAVVDGNFCYEIRVPLTDIGGKVSGTPSSKTRKIAVGIQIGGMTEAERELIESTVGTMRDDMMSGHGGGRGGMGGSSMGGGGMGGMGGRGGMGGSGMDMNSRLDPEITWIKLVLPPIN